MRGQVETPDALVDKMLSYLFERMPPKANHRLLDAGCGNGAFIEGVIRWCRAHKLPLPRILGIEQDPEVADRARNNFREFAEIEILTKDYLRFDTDERFDFAVGNPPYVGLAEMEQEERQHLRQQFASARGRFDLYMLFFEHSLALLKPRGRLAFVTPEKWLYVDSARALRELMSAHRVEKLEFLDPNAFPGRITYPAISVIRKHGSPGSTQVMAEDSRREIQLTNAGSPSWLGCINGAWVAASDTVELRDVCRRIGVGIATGAEKVFCLSRAHLPSRLKPFARPTIAGRDLDPADRNANNFSRTTDVMLMPYDSNGGLIAENQLGALGEYLREKPNNAKLRSRSCTVRKAWYAFHDSFNADMILQPKLLCKDICNHPTFWVDRTGDIVPRHSVYYIIPSDPEMLQPLADWLNGDRASEWLRLHAQRAANGYLRLQSGVLGRLPVPRRFLGAD